VTRPAGGFGPGALVTAAFIGPGTVTLCTLAGVNNGLSLAWVIPLSVLLCYTLQEMSARLGVISGQGLGETLRREVNHPLTRNLSILLVLCAIVVGNAAYEAGNISGGALGLQELTGNHSLVIGDVRINLVNLSIAALAFLLLYTGDYRVLEKTLIGLVAAMSIAFVLVAVATRPAPGDLLRGLVPRMSAGQTLTVIGLVGTTVVPYNLFLHARIVQEKWQGSGALPAMRRDTAIAIALGGIISLAIIVCGASLQGTQIRSAAELATALQPVFGDWARYILAFGLFAAGITSAITAPLAACYVAGGCLGWQKDLRSLRYRLVWMGVLLAGTAFSVIGGSPVEIIRLAQVTNGILLPLIAGFVLWALNRKGLLGGHHNTPWQNLAGGLALLLVTLLAGRSLWLVMQG
jgi:Mn2+/Fe2+ NRAMP family transporter